MKRKSDSTTTSAIEIPYRVSVRHPCGHLVKCLACVNRVRTWRLKAEGYPNWKAEGRTYQGYLKLRQRQNDYNQRNRDKKNKAQATYENKFRRLYGDRAGTQARAKWLDDRQAKREAMAQMIDSIKTIKKDVGRRRAKVVQNSMKKKPKPKRPTKPKPY